MNNIYNGEDIVEKARKEAKRELPENDIPHMEDLFLSKIYHYDLPETIKHEVGLLHTNADIATYRPLNSRHGSSGKVTLLFKKAIRKLIKFYIEPITADQNTYNLQVARTMDFILESLNRKDEEIKELREALNHLIKKNHRG